jgi:hypothetical protein
MRDYLSLCNGFTLYTIIHPFRLFLKTFNLYSPIFPDQAKKPVHKLFRDALDDTYDYWCNIREYVFQNRPGSEELWHFNPKAGWHVRVRYHKRVIVYCIPCNSFFAILLVLGEKAMREAMKSNLSDCTLQIIQTARTHTEGSSFYIEVKDDSLIKDIKKLLAIKLFLK